MKTVFLISLLIFSTAQASWYQENCSNSDRTTMVSEGHNDNFMKVTKIFWNQGTSVRRLFVLNPETHTMTVLKEQLLAKFDNGDRCPLYTEIHYREVSFKKIDGRLFAKEFDGVSEDRKEIRAHLICEHRVSDSCGWEEGDSNLSPPRTSIPLSVR